VYVFAGVLNGTTNDAKVIQFGVPLLGPGYRIAVVIHMTAAMAQNAKVQQTVGDVLSRRIIVPSAAH
jgi:hypothetical protein